MRIFVTLVALLWFGIPAGRGADWYVATNGTGGGTNWADATNSIQGAIDASSAGDTVWVSNGVYEAGGVTNYPAGTLLTNRVAITKAITVRSTNGPAVTTIKGSRPNGPAAVRCVYMTNGSSLIGFTMTNGATLVAGWVNDGYGGGIWSDSQGIISNCVITSNSAATYGAGVVGGTYYNCTISHNSSASYAGGAGGGTYYNCTISNNYAFDNAGGVYAGTLYNCMIVGNTSPNSGPGGAQNATMFNCVISNNWTPYFGGGVRGGTLSNCTIVGNSAGEDGGGAYDSILYNCMIIGNSAKNGGGAMYGTYYNCTFVGNYASVSAGGVKDLTCFNSIIYFNSAGTSGSNWDGNISFTNSCTTTNQPGWAPGNITDDPMFMANGSGYGTNFVAGNYRLQASSPCVNAGLNQSWMTNAVDLDGQIRIRHGRVDMGAFEKILEGTIFSAY